MDVLSFRSVVLSAMMFLAAVLAGCAGGYPKLTSITIKPASATAQKSIQGTVQFVATGTYSDGRTVSPLTAQWSFNPPFVYTPIAAGATIDSNGLAQCLNPAAQSGSITFPVYAAAPVNPSIPLSEMTVRTPYVTGKAQLTCE